MKDDEVSDLFERLVSEVQPKAAPIPEPMVTKRGRRHLVVAGAALGVGAIVAATALSGGEPGRTAPPDGPVPVDTDPGGLELLADALVLEDDSHGPQLCVGAVMESLPVPCSGPDIPNWRWSDVEGESRLRGTTDGQYVVTGVFDPDAFTFTLTRPAIPREEYDGPPVPRVSDDPLGTPCEEPPGGWRPQDPARTTDETFQQTAARARQMEGFAGLWLDQTGTTQPNDPKQFVLNVAFVLDHQEREAELRETWGGALCVTWANWTEHQLRRMQTTAYELAGDLALAASSGRDVVRLDVIYDDGSLQARLDDEFEPGVAVVFSALRPAESEPVSMGLGHCFAEPVEFAGRSWNLPLERQFGWGGLAPAIWVGTGTISRVGEDRARYLDDGGVALLLLPTDHPSVARIDRQICM